MNKSDEEEPAHVYVISTHFKSHFKIHFKKVFVDFVDKRYMNVELTFG